MDISVSYEGLRSTAAKMKQEVEKMRQALETATTVMNRTGESFKSNAADEIRGKYTALKPKFEDFYAAINNYAEFLEKTAAGYQEADQTIQKIAEEVLTSDYNA